MAKAKIDPVVAAEETAIQTLCGSLANPAEPLFVGSAAKVKLAADVALKRGWVAVHEQVVGKKKIKSYRITPAGIQQALVSGEVTRLVQGVSQSVVSSRKAIVDIESQLQGLQANLQAQSTVLERLIQRIVPPNLEEILSKAQVPSTTSESLSVSKQGQERVDQKLLGNEILHALEDYQRRSNPGQFCTLKELYHLAAHKPGATIGEFHECLRELNRQHKIRLVPWGSPMFDLPDELFAMVSNKEVKYYVHLDK